MVKKAACVCLALAAIVAILFFVHAKVDSYHGAGDAHEITNQHGETLH